MTNIVKINNIDEDCLALYAKYNEVQLLRYFEPAEGIFIAESPMIIERALDAGYEPISILMEEKYVEGQGKEILKRCNEIPVYVAPLEVMRQLTGYEITRGMLCAMRRKPLSGAEEICEKARRIVVLENVMNPTNVGAIFRSAAALGMDGILLTEGCSDPLYRRASRVSMGTVFQIPWSSFTKQNSWEEGKKLLQQMGYKTVAMALRKDTISISDERLKKEEKLAILMGTEGQGLAEETIDSCDYKVKIPMYHQVDSLNVAAASAIAFWELTK